MAFGKCWSAGKDIRSFNSWIPASSVKNIMNSDNSFYLTLLINGSQTLYPDNTVGAFTTELVRPIELDPEFRWQVSPCEFSCPAVLAHEGSDRCDLIGLIYCDLISP
jgi:hypothetical protein